MSAEETDETLRWTPALALSFDVIGQKAHASIRNGPVLGPPLPDGCPASEVNPNGRPGSPGQLCPRSNFDQRRDTQIRPDARGNDTMAAPLVGGSAELVTPRLLDALGRPRLFARADLALSYGFESNLAGEAEPGLFARPPFLRDDRQIPEIAVGGQGSRAIAQLDRFTFSGGAGIVFTRTLWGRSVRFRSSFEYLREVLDFKGVTQRAVAIEQDDLTLARFRFIRLSGETQKTYHAFGGGLEIEADSWRYGPIRSGVFVGGRLLRFTGSLETTLRDTNEFGETATWQFEKEPWSWRGYAGIRFRWVPE